MIARNHRLGWLAGAVLLVSAPSSHAESTSLSDAEAKRIFNERSCNACHEVDETRIGPAFRTVGLRYKQSGPDAANWLAAKIVSGGAGSWGNVPMISYPKLPPDEAKAIARWILALGPKKAEAKTP